MNVTLIFKRHGVRSVACPECGARPGHYCVRVNGGKRYANHKGRCWVYSKLNKETK